MNSTLKDIARDYLFITSYERTDVPSRDFHDLPIWMITAALEAAYQAGFEAGLNAKEGEVFLD